MAELMRNKYLKFENIEFQGVNVKNTSLLSKIKKIPEKYLSENYIQTIRIDDNKLLEAISFELYDDTNYWDLLMIINDMKSMYELPKDYDLLYLEAEAEFDKWLNIADLIVNNDYDETLTYDENITLRNKIKFDSIIEDLVKNNEKHRILKYIRQYDLSLLLADLNKNAYDEIDSDIIINIEKSK